MNNFRSLLKKYLIFFVVICLPVIQEASAKILDQQGKVLKEVVEIFRQYKFRIEDCADDIVAKKGISRDKVEHILNPKTPVSEISLSDLNDIAQIVFLRPSDKERKDIRPTNKIFLPYTNEKVFQLFKKLGDINSIYPKRNHYTYIFINGATVPAMRKRLKTLVDLVNVRKIRVTSKTQIVFLTGERDLFEEENLDQLMNPAPLKLDPAWKKPDVIPTTEDQAAEWIWYQSDLPCALKNAKVIFVRAQKKSEVDPNTQKTVLKRPTTLDTIETWIKDHQPQTGRCLSISNQPYVYYQKATIEGAFQAAGLLERGFSIEGVGLTNPELTPTTFKDNIAVLLDNLARSIFTETNNSKNRELSHAHKGG